MFFVDQAADTTSAQLSTSNHVSHNICAVTLQQRVGGTLEIAAKKEVATLCEARQIERLFKRKKKPKLAIHYLQR